MRPMKLILLWFQMFERQLILLEVVPSIFNPVNNVFSLAYKVQQTFFVLATKLTRPSYFQRGHPTLKLSAIRTFTLIVSLTYSMDNIQINLHYSIKFLAIGVNVMWLQCHASLGSESKFSCFCHFFVKISCVEQSFTKIAKAQYEKFSVFQIQVMTGILTPLLNKPPNL